MSGEAETVRPLEALGRLCERRGWALCLATSADRYADGKRAPSISVHAVVEALCVVEPRRVPQTRIPRVTALLTGRVLARVPLRAAAGDVPELTVDAAAERCFESLGRKGLLQAGAA